MRLSECRLGRSRSRVGAKLGWFHTHHDRSPGTRGPRAARLNPTNRSSHGLGLLRRFHLSSRRAALFSAIAFSHPLVALSPLCIIQKHCCRNLVLLAVAQKKGGMGGWKFPNHGGRGARVVGERERDLGNEGREAKGSFIFIIILVGAAPISTQPKYQTEPPSTRGSLHGLDLPRQSRPDGAVTFDTRCRAGRGNVHTGLVAGRAFVV